MTPDTLKAEWEDLLERRPAFLVPLAVCGDILDLWARWSPTRLSPLMWSAEECRHRWERGVPLLAEAPAEIDADEIEDLLGAVMERVAEIDRRAAAGLQRFAEAWDRGTITPRTLFPVPGHIGSGVADTVSGLAPELITLLAYAGLRPALDVYFTSARSHLNDDVWRLGACPFCGGPAGFSDVLEDGRRRLACHLCGGGWIYSRVRCPFCGTESAQDLVRLEPETADQGYLLIACTRCHQYVKELDRRVRWNAQSGLIEDWGSPHLDLVGRRAGYRRPAPTPLTALTTG